jgi:hypothetical protein
MIFGISPRNADPKVRVSEDSFIAMILKNYEGYEPI